MFVERQRADRVVREIQTELIARQDASRDTESW